MRRLKAGVGTDPDVDMGPVVNEGALAAIAGYVRSAADDGAVVAAGGNVMSGGIFDEGYYFEPTVLFGVTPAMKVAVEEIFGPVLSVLRVRTWEEALEVCNATEYGLTASVFTDRMDYAYDFRRRAEVGMVRVNNLGVSGGNMPFGGVKNSGLGPFSIGHTNVEFYTNLKVVYETF